MKLNPTTEKFVLHWGEMGSQWGVNRSVAQIHALLFMLGRPLNAEQIAETLGLARSNVSTSLKELQTLRLVTVTHQMGDRRDYFETSGDVWALFRVIVEERQRRELEPTRQFLQQLVDSPEFAQENAIAKDRIVQTHQLVSTLSTWSVQMLSLSTSTLVKILRLGATIQKLVK